MALADPAPDAPDEGLLILLPAVAGERWRWWRVSDGALEGTRSYDPDEGEIWGSLPDDARVVALVPSAQAPVRTRPRGEMPLAQAVAAARLETEQTLGEGWEAGGLHIAAAPAADESAILVAGAAQADMDLWLAGLAAAGLMPQALVPAALVLPPTATPLTAELEGQPLVRTADAAFAGEPELVAALAAGEPRGLDDDELVAGLLAAWRDPPLNLRQGPYAPKRVSIFRLPDWTQLARMAAVAALLGFLVLAVEIVKLEWDASAREQAALAAAQKRFPAAVDLASAQTLVTAELARRGQGGGSFAVPASALLAAMRPIPSLKLRELGYVGDGTLRFQAAAPTADEINKLLTALQQEGWQVTVPPSLAPDPTGATVAAITVRAP
ncbi:MAG: hypothetical protein LC648_02880 [Novosphingobium sp.]|nr:hypothetical protein [Novosphingobium sp.]